MDKALKQRLVGASVLIALAVIVLPMLLGGRPDGSSTEPEKIELPEQPPDLSFETRRYPIGEQPTPVPDSSESSEQANRRPPLPVPRIPDTPELDEQTPDVETAPEEQGLSVTALGPAPTESATGEGDQDESADTPLMPESEPSEPPVNLDKSESPDSAAGRYVVQVASFGAANNANRLSRQLTSDGYAVVTDTVKSDVGTLHRVRVGPYGSEAEAKKAAAALGSSIEGVNPRIVDLHPDRAAQVSSPEDPLVRWVVQVGSFSDSSNAENVVAALRLKGMSAYQDKLSSGSSDIYRVRVGPFLSRNDATKAESEINQSLSVSAVVMTMD